MIKKIAISIIYGFASFGCFKLISSLDKVDDNMEVGIGVVGIAGAALGLLCIGGIISLFIKEK